LVRPTRIPGMPLGPGRDRASRRESCRLAALVTHQPPRFARSKWFGPTGNAVCRRSPAGLRQAVTNPGGSFAFSASLRSLAADARLAASLRSLRSAR